MDWDTLYSLSGTSYNSPSFAERVVKEMYKISASNVLTRGYQGGNLTDLERKYFELFTELKERQVHEDKKLKAKHARELQALAKWWKKQNV